MEASVAGITFRVMDNAAIGMLTPSGVVDLVHVPFVHPTNERFSDPLAVQVHWEGHFLGYLPAKGEARAAFHECAKTGLDICATVKDFSYAKYDGGKIVDGSFNDRQEGMLASVTLDIRAGVTDDSYFFDNEQYLRASTVANALDEVGFPLPRHLFDWQHKFKNYEAYLDGVQVASDDGNDKHDACESLFRDGAALPTLPHGVEEIRSRYNVEYVASEQIVKDDELKVAGKFDMLAYVTNDGERLLVNFDWKRGKVLKFAYLLQSAFYAKKNGADAFWVVLLGTGNKCGYSIKMFGKEDIGLLYECFAHLAKAYRIAKTYKQFKN